MVGFFFSVHRQREAPLVAGSHRGMFQWHHRALVVLEEALTGLGKQRVGAATMELELYSYDGEKSSKGCPSGSFIWLRVPNPCGGPTLSCSEVELERKTDLFEI
jgi:hypothetical protein